MAPPWQIFDNTNFISPKLVKEAGIIVDPQERCWVKVGDSYQIKSEGICNKVPIQLQGLSFQQKLHVFPLDDLDVFQPLPLGWERLEDLGELKANFKNFTLKVKK